MNWGIGSASLGLPPHWLSVSMSLFFIGDCLLLLLNLVCAVSHERTFPAAASTAGSITVELDVSQISLSRMQRDTEVPVTGAHVISTQIKADVMSTSSLNHRCTLTDTTES